jgi:ketosteroid isomerase-like protein
MNPTAVIERYLTLIADPTADPAAIGELLDPEARFIEHPNLFSPRGSERDRAQVLASLKQGRVLVHEQRFDVIDHLVAGDTIATRAVWTGTLAVEAPPFAAGARLRADSSMYFDVRDGRIVRQENYDCFHLQETGGGSEGGSGGTNAGAEGS